MIFAKLFDYPDGQLLVTLNKDYDPDEVTVIFRTDTETLSVEAKMRNEDVAAGEELFASFGEPEATVRYNNLQKMMKR